MTQPKVVRKPRSSGSSARCRTHPTGGPHLGMTVLTAGLWLPVWAVSSVMARRKSRGTVAPQG